MIIKKLMFTDPDFPEVLRTIPAPPKQLFITGTPLEDLLKRPCVAIVGTRKITPYGRQVTTELAGKLAGQGIIIISGLAYGVDAAAHQAALDAGGQAIAVLPSPLDNIVPAANRRLAGRILDQDGTLISEYPSGEPPYKQNFIARNRLVSGLADAVLITEAGEKSGALHTANFAVNQGKDIFVVPGNIYLPGSKGINNLLKQGQATPVTSCTDILQALGLSERQTPAHAVKGDNKQEQAILDLLVQGISEGERLLEQSSLEVSIFNQALTMLEITGKVRPLGANQWAIR
jgi:DNA processing protein